jgi:hypothetical protein
VVMGQAYTGGLSRRPMRQSAGVVPVRQVWEARKGQPPRAAPPHTPRSDRRGQADAAAEGWRRRSSSLPHIGSPPGSGSQSCPGARARRAAWPAPRPGWSGPRRHAARTSPRPVAA